MLCATNIRKKNFKCVHDVTFKKTTRNMCLGMCLDFFFLLLMMLRREETGGDN